MAQHTGAAVRSPVTVTLNNDRTNTQTCITVSAELAALLAYADAWARQEKRSDNATLSFSSTLAALIEQLLAAQIQLRNNRRLQAAMRSSRLPVVKQLGDFDFTFQPSVRREQIESLHELGFVKRRENVIFLGPPGVGKTHLAISLAIAAAQSGRRVYYGTLADLITSLEEAQGRRSSAGPSQNPHASRRAGGR